MVIRKVKKISLINKLSTNQEIEIKMNKIAILYQAKLPPAKDGIQKPMKPGGYSDSGADIAAQLKKGGVEVVTPVKTPNPNIDKEWVFPDTTAGIEEALGKGVNTFWLNTVLYKDHPIENCYDRGIELVGQSPESVDVFDDKTHTNELLKRNKIPIPKNQIITKQNNIDAILGLQFPMVLKPIRGRGSQGVSKIENRIELKEKLDVLFTKNDFGSAAYIENYLSGQEITISVMPKGKYQLNNDTKHFDRPWCLPAVKRINHSNGIAPYNGIVAVMENSEVLNDLELKSEQIQEVNKHCIKAAEIIDIKAPIRIDCRANEKGKYFLFDLNMKPNMTGPSRQHRKNQDSLSLLAARKIGWNYLDLLNNILNQKWKASS